MDKLSYRLSDAAEALSVDESTLTDMRDACLLITYTIDGREFVTDYALRDLQQRLEMGITAEDCSIGIVARENVADTVRGFRHRTTILGGTLETVKP